MWKTNHFAKWNCLTWLSTSNSILVLSNAFNNFNKKSFSALEQQRQFGHNRYEPVWLMLHKLRDVMGQRDKEYQLTDVIDLDEGFFSTVTIDSEKTEPLKRGRGSQKKSKVLVMVESIPVEGVKTKKGNYGKWVTLEC
jgi:hypothetical protein